MLKRILPPILLAALAGIVIYVAMDYGQTARQLPVLIASTTLVLAVLDLLSRLGGKTGRLLQITLGAGFESQEMDFEPRLRNEVVQLCWVVGVVGSIVLFGILVTVPVFVFAYTLVHGNWSILFSVLAAVLVLAIVGIIFEVLLDYTLFRGIVFGAETYV